MYIGVYVCVYVYDHCNSFHTVTHTNIPSNDILQLTWQKIYIVIITRVVVYNISCVYVAVSSACAQSVVWFSFFFVVFFFLGVLTKRLSL